MSRPETPVREALADARDPADRAERRAVLVARSLLAALALALYTIAGLIMAFIALVPTALRGGPVGRRATSIGPSQEATEPATTSAEQALPR